jgi:hypothetical protein
MKRFIGLFVATVAAAAIPLSAAGASPAPADYQPGCDQLYNAGKPVFDAIITNAKPAAQSAEKSFCGDNKYAK